MEAHIDECADCRALLKDLANGLPSSPNASGNRQADTHFSKTLGEALTKKAPIDAPTASLSALHTGTLIADRYWILEMIGMGGMGRVYAAYDRQLDRKVALKLLREKNQGADPLLLREAQSLAKLSHPNVVIVHDIGMALGQTYMAMEHIDGRTLRAWLKSERPGIEQILEAYLEAAKGLAAAHAAGLVHRDFKPDNVLIGKDGRVRVSDFGLARPVFGQRLASQEKQSESPSEPAEPESSAAPQTRLEGTPLYIAPERFAGKPSDAKCDQFSYCVSLYEALYGEYPFELKSLSDLAEVVQEGKVRPAPKGSKVPARVRNALLKGLSPDPALRYADMDALIYALQAPLRPRTLLSFAIPALILSIGIVSAAYTLKPKEAPPPLCQGSALKLEGIWDEDHKNIIRKALLASGLPYAQTAWKSVESSMDSYAERWVSAHRKACVETRIYGEHSEEVLERRNACLGIQLLQFKALGQALAEIQGETVSKAAEATSKLSDPALCESVDVLRNDMLPPKSQDMAKQVEALRARLARSEALLGLGREKENLEETEAIWKEALALDYAPIQAEAGQILAMTHRRPNSPKAMAHILKQALFAAESGNHERAALRIWLELAFHAIWREARYDEAEDALNHAEAYLKRIGGQMERLRLYSYRSALNRAQEKKAEALEAAKQAVASAEQAFGPDSIYAASALMELGINAHLAKQPQESREAFRRALRIAESFLGEQHPAIASISTNFGRVLIGQDPSNSKEYLPLLKRALDITEPLGGPAFGEASIGYAGGLVAAKRYEEALTFIQQYMTAGESALGPYHPTRVSARIFLGTALAGVLRMEEACATFQQAYAIALQSEVPKEMGEQVRSQAKETLGTCNKKICKETLLALEDKPQIKTADEFGGRK